MNREVILEYLRGRNARKMPTIAELASELNIEGKELTGLISLINNMELTGDIILTKKNRIALPEDLGYFSGKIQIHQRGFGFLIRDGEKDKKSRNDIFIPPDVINSAMNGDTVLVKLSERTPLGSAKLEGEVVKIIKRNTTTVIGVYQESANFGFVVPEDKKIRNDIFVQKGDSLNAKNNDVVVCEITKYSTDSKSTAGKIISVLGRKGDPGVDMLAIFAKYALPDKFPDKVLEYVSNIDGDVANEEMTRRRDLRGEVIVTIDGADAKDLDDAVTVKRMKNGNYKLGVHIADVTHYVKEGSILDEEALKRATSVYLLDTVIPMLPQRLSNNLCSLNPATDKLTLSCEMEIDPNGQVLNHDIYESVIRTTERMTYDDVTGILRDKDEALISKYKNLVPVFQEMEELYQILNKKRLKRGAIDFDFTESFIELNENGEPVDVRPMERAVANRIIEEFMLAANETVAEHMFWTHVPFVYRIHADPDPEKLQIFADFATNLGVPIRMGKNIEPRHLQEVLRAVKGTEAEQVLSKLLLRSMMQAKYSPSNLGHFGLAADYYCHFTSPIRRYPDLQIHRIIKKHLNGQLSPAEINKYLPIVEKTSIISSDMERVAEDAEREVDDMKKTEYMHAHLGEEFDGVISSVTNFGFFVELPNTIEGLVHISDLAIGYAFDESKMALLSETGYDDFRLGQRIRVQVAAADVESRQISFAFLGRMDSEGAYKERSDSKETRAPLILGNFRSSSRKKGETAKSGRNDKPGKAAGKSKAPAAAASKGKFFGRGKGKADKKTTKH